MAVATVGGLRYSLRAPMATPVSGFCSTIARMLHSTSQHTQDFGVCKCNTRDVPELSCRRRYTRPLTLGITLNKSASAGFRTAFAQPVPWG